MFAKGVLYFSFQFQNQLNPPNDELKLKCLANAWTLDATTRSYGGFSSDTPGLLVPGRVY